MFPLLLAFLAFASSFAMSYWESSTVTEATLLRLVESGHLPELTEAREWIVPGDEMSPRPPKGYVVSFVSFHERGFALPANSFFRGLLHEYEICLHHLNPNGIQDIATFVAICEGYLEKPPHFDLWRYFFAGALQAPTANRGVLGMPFEVGCAGIHLRGERSAGFPLMGVNNSNKGWQRKWFYLKNHPQYGVPEFSRTTFNKRPSSWHWGVAADQVKKLEPFFRALLRLKAAGVTGPGTTGAYHARGVAPLMRRTLSLNLMGPNATQEDLAKTVLRGGPPSAGTILARLRDAFSGKAHVFPIPGHPPMHPDVGALALVRVFSSRVCPIRHCHMSFVPQTSDLRRC